MGEQCCSNDGERKKGFFGRLFDKLDKKLEAKSKASCCDEDDKKKDSGSSCCN